MRKMKMRNFMTVHKVIVLLLLMLPLQMVAQEEVKRAVRDSVQLQGEMISSGVSTEFMDEAVDIPTSGLSDSSSIHIPLTLPLMLPYAVNPSPMFSGDYATSGVLSASDRGVLYGSGSQTTLPGLGRMNNAALGYRYYISPLLVFQLEAAAMKMTLPYSSGMSFGTSGKLTYQLADNLAVNAFGSYYAGRTFGMNSHSFGGSLTVNLTERFSLEAGVQRRYNPFRSGWETVPVLVPTYQFNRMKLGMDVGGLLYELLHRAVIDKKNLKMGNPTIAPSF